MNLKNTPSSVRSDIVAVRQDYAAPTGLEFVLFRDSTKMPRLRRWAGGPRNPALKRWAIVEARRAGIFVEHENEKQFKLRRSDIVGRDGALRRPVIAAR